MIHQTPRTSRLSVEVDSQKPPVRGAQNGLEPGAKDSTAVQQRNTEDGAVRVSVDIGNALDAGSAARNGDSGSNILNDDIQTAEELLDTSLGSSAVSQANNSLDINHTPTVNGSANETLILPKNLLFADVSPTLNPWLNSLQARIKTHSDAAVAEIQARDALKPVLDLNTKVLEEICTRQGTLRGSLEKAQQDFDTREQIIAADSAIYNFSSTTDAQDTVVKGFLASIKSRFDALKADQAADSQRIQSIQIELAEVDAKQRREADAKGNLLCQIQLKNSEIKRMEDCRFLLLDMDNTTREQVGKYKALLANMGHNSAGE